MSVTLADIASRVGVHRSTVSLALNDLTAQKLSSKRVGDIRRAATQMGYSPNLSARQLSCGKTWCIGVVMNYLDYYPYNRYFYLISEYCSERGYHAIPMPMKHGNDQVHEHPSLLENTRVDGFVILEYTPSTAAYAHEQAVADQPVVLRISDPDQRPRKHPHVWFDNANQLTELIIEIVKRGWEHLYLIVEKDPQRPNPFVDRHGLLPYEAKGIAEAVAQTGIKLPLSQRIIYGQGRRAKTYYEALNAYLEKNTFPAGTCLLHCGADGVSGTYGALAKAGLTVGRDIAVAATNPTPPWEYVLPELSYCFEYHEQTSRLLVELAINEIEKTVGSTQKPLAGRSPPISNHPQSTCRINMNDSVPQRL